MFARLSLDYGWTFEQISHMTLDQIYLACSQGKAPKGGIRIRTGDPEEMAQIRRNWRRFI